MKRFLVPLDGSKFAERALSAASALSTRHDADLHLASVISDVPPTPFAVDGSEFLSQWFADEEERAREYLDRLVEGLPASVRSRTTIHARVGPVSASIREIAAEIDADLVALTTHGRGRLKRVWLGSIADQLLRKLERPLLLLRADDDSPLAPFEADGPLSALVPLDGSDAAEGILPVIADVAGGTEGAALRLVSVVEEGFAGVTPYLPDAIADDALLEASRERTAEYLADLGSRLRSEGWARVEERVLSAEDAANAILDLVESEPVDIVALTTHGRGRAARFFLGSVADKILRGSEAPILVARREESDAE